jgi:hypothetical protein
MASQKKKAQYSREEEILLQDFSRNVSTKSSALFYGNAAIVAAVPVCKSLNFHKEHCNLDFVDFIFCFRDLLAYSSNGTSNFLHLFPTSNRFGNIFGCICI